MRSCLIGYTGFVGSNLDLQYTFTDRYNSKNIEAIDGKSYDFCICAGVKAQKWVANQNAELDLDEIKSLIKHLEKAKIKRFILISTVDVYPKPIGVDEDSQINRDNHHAYGLNRLYLEDWVAHHFEDYLIIRLPGLIGQNIKKNFIYDILHPVPSLFNEAFFTKLLGMLSEHDRPLIEAAYQKNGVNYVWDKSNAGLVKGILAKHDVSSLMFTDSEDVFQFYDLSELSKHITLCLDSNIHVVNLASEPIMAKDLFSFLFKKEFKNHLDRPKQNYDMLSKHCEKLGGVHGYVHSKSEIMERIQTFIAEQTQ